MKKLVKKINEVFVGIVLFIFYLLFIGSAKLVKLVFYKSARRSDESYWRDKKDLTKKSLFSAY
jgi:uncharacterized protein YqhQ